MWREVTGSVDFDYLMIDSREVAAVSCKDGESTIYLKSGANFRLVGDTLRRPTFKTMEGGDIEVNLALVRTAVLLDFTTKEWHYQLKFGDDGFLEVLSDRPISL